MSSAQQPRFSKYQHGTLDRVKRAKGPDVWVYRYRETSDDGERVQRKRVVGTVLQLKTEKAAQQAVENLRSEINAATEAKPKITVGEAWGHFQKHELYNPAVARSPSTVHSYLDYFKVKILPEWRNVPLEDVKAVKVEAWLHSLPLAKASKAKIRNHMSALFSHCIRHELYDRMNPISSVRQSAIRQRDPDTLTLEEMRAIISRIESRPIQVMVMVAASSALRRSEIRGLRWSDIDFDAGLLRLQRGFFRKEATQLKTHASRKPVPMLPALADELRLWRSQTPYPRDQDWVFASPTTNGERPYWLDMALKMYIRPAAEKAGIAKHIGWHTFRHSVATLLGQDGEDVKVVQELLHHANSRITREIYQQADHANKRAALSPFTGLFVVPKAS